MILDKDAEQEADAYQWHTPDEDSSAGCGVGSFDGNLVRSGVMRQVRTRKCTVCHRR